MIAVVVCVSLLALSIPIALGMRRKRAAFERAWRERVK